MIMKKTLKKIAAVMMAVLMMGQIIPALAGTYSSGIVVGGAQGYREILEIVASKGTYVLTGQTLELDVNEGYRPSWTSADETVATIDENGVLTALVPGTVTITATEGGFSATTVVTVIDPEPLMEEARQEEPAATEPEPEADPENPEPVEQAPAQKQYMIIVINGESTRYVYNGEEQTLNTFVATSNQDFFDASKIRVVGEIGVSATNCGTYEFKLAETDFAYDDPNVIASFVVNNGWMKITPAQVTVSANPATKEAGQPDPVLTATVEGLYGEDMIAYSFDRYPGEAPGAYIIDAVGEEKQGNYKIQYISGIMTITEPVVVYQEPLDVQVTCLHPAGTPVEYGMGISLAAEVTGAAEGEYTIQWQYSADMQNWIDIPGANSLSYTFTANGETVTYAWRAVADRIQ